MLKRISRVSIGVLAIVAATAHVAAAQTCIRIDETADMLNAEERTAAVLLVKRQFEQAGQKVSETDCQAVYSLSHVRLGRTIIVSISGPLGTREGKALGLDDLPAVYSQMVRSLTTGEPMGSLGVLDRGNVSAAQDQPPRRVQSEAFWHARVGQATLFGPSTHYGASFGFGYRAEFDRVGLDVSFFNVQTSSHHSSFEASGSAWSLVKLTGLYFFSPTADRSAYAGAGLSYGHVSMQKVDDLEPYPAYGDGSGLQVELSGGYEIARVTSARFFVQGDVTLPLYDVVFERYSYTPVTGRSPDPSVTVSRYYTPSVTISVGLGWRRGR